MGKTLKDLKGTKGGGKGTPPPKKTIIKNEKVQKIKGHFDAFVKALLCGLYASCEDQTKRAVEMAEFLASGLTQPLLNDAAAQAAAYYETHDEMAEVLPCFFPKLK